MGTLRILLALSVIATHSTAIFGTKLIPGNFAVEVFFVISGFYMALILSTKYTGKNGKWLFYQNRWLRLYPAYLCIILLTWAWFFFSWIWMRKVPTTQWIAAYHSMPLPQKLFLIVSNWSMIGLDVPSLFRFVPGIGFFWGDGSKSFSWTNNYWLGDFRTIGQAWYVGTEIWFYLMAPWIIRRGIPVICFVLASSLIFKLYLEFYMGCATYFIFPAQLCWFLTGILLYRFYKSRLFCPLSTCAARVLLVAVLVVFIIYSRITSPLKVLFIFPFLRISIPYLFHAMRRSEHDRHFGNLSYPIYLSHMLILAMLQNVFKTNNGTLAAIATVAVATVIYRFIEEPMDRYRQRRVATREDSPRPILLPS